MESVFTHESYKTFYRENLAKSGIYFLRCNGRIYIGRALCISHRISEHLGDMRKNIHYNTKLQSSYNKYGKDSFEFGVVEYMIGSNTFELDIREKEIGLKYNCLDKYKGFNFMLGSDNRLESKEFKEIKTKENRRDNNKKVVRLDIKDIVVKIYPSMKSAKEECSWCEQAIHKKPRTYITHSRYIYIMYDEFVKIASFDEYIADQLKKQQTKKLESKRGIRVDNVGVVDLEMGIFYESIRQLYDTLNIPCARISTHVVIPRMKRFLILKPNFYDKFNASYERSKVAKKRVWDQKTQLV